MIMAPAKGKAAYKKKDGVIAISDDQTVINWAPLPGTGPPVVSLTIAGITSEQHTTQHGVAWRGVALVC